MKMNKGALIMALLMAAHVCHAAVLPSGSRFDPRNQIVSYNPNNTTIINSAVGYTTTLVFDEDETVISARTGFPQGWAVNKEDNLVYLEVRPVWICPYISRHLLSLNPLQARCRRYSRGER